MIIAFALSAALLAVPATGDAIGLADAVRMLAHDSVLLAASDLLVERNRSAKSYRTLPKASVFATGDRSIDDRSPRNAVVGDEFTSQSRFTRFDSLFGGVELSLPVIGGFARVRAGPRVSTLQLDQPIDDPSSTRDRITGEIEIPVYPWRLDLDYLSEEELRNEVSFLRSVASHRERVTALAGRAASFAWLTSADQQLDPYIASIKSIVDTATILARYGEISPQELESITSAAADIEILQGGWQSEMGTHRSFLARIIGKDAAIAPPTALAAPDSVVLPDAADATEVQLATAELALAERRDRIARRETGSSVKLEANLLSDRYHDPFDERQRTFAAVSVTVPFFNPAGNRKRSAATAEVVWTNERLQDIAIAAELVSRERIEAYRNALSEAEEAGRRHAMNLHRMKAIRAEFEGYQDPSSVVRLAQMHLTLARDLDRILRAETDATRYLVELLVEAGVGIETLAAYLR